MYTFQKHLDVENAVHENILLNLSKLCMKICMADYPESHVGQQLSMACFGHFIAIALPNPSYIQPNIKAKFWKYFLKHHDRKFVYIRLVHIDNKSCICT